MTTIHATGTSESRHQAELATVHCQINAQAESRAQSIDAASTLHNKILDLAKQLQDSGDATKFTAEAINTWMQQYGDGVSSPVRKEYVTSSTVTITLSNLELVSELVAKLAAEGVSTHVSWSLTTESRRDYEREARKAAVGVAREIAEDYADALGEKVTSVVSISDSRGGGFAPAPRMAMAMSDSAGASAEVTIAEITVSATVEGVFEAA